MLSIHPKKRNALQLEKNTCKLRKHFRQFDNAQAANAHNTIKKRNVLQIEKHTCKLRKHFRQFNNAHQARFLPAINRWADRYPGWAIIVGGVGVVVVVDR